MKEESLTHNKGIRGEYIHVIRDELVKQTIRINWGGREKNKFGRAHGIPSTIERINKKGKC